MPRKPLRQRKNPNDTNNRLNRVRFILDNIIGTEDPDDLMFSIIETLKDTVLIPDIGKYYTFIYAPKTPGSSYDAHPLVAVTNIYSWGFRGINFHWNRVRQYTWEEIVGSLHIVNSAELKDLKSIPFAKIIK
jgi:hypothetical protein